ncbi:response regulator transcription factor [Amycolatopsis sp. FDAARGOS 1241]|uniref:response regulator n=1 Tax=Amycolatopsis sp. FDAARGOS 1241 TaxID=2778070 RepID=UPI00194E2641|nr:response regulator transcription factor [Amycolatopsis sp. FDAARGOS 1241]QRP49151.1 response regulator transcription factor [Amycolatopsis sp. FDAARGOS 1241]
MIRVLIADDHAIVRTGLAQLLITAGDLELVGSAGDGEEAVALAAQLSPDVVLMDLSMPGTDGAAATARIVAANPAAHVLVLTSFSDRTRILDALRAGAEGYLLKHSEPEVILAGIREVVAGGSPLDPKAARVLLSDRRAARPAAQLTAREREVLRMVGDGLPNKSIARRLGISERTVKAHLTNVYQRLGVTDRTQAALWAQRHGDQFHDSDQFREGC